MKVLFDGLLALSSSLDEAKNAYLTYCENKIPYKAEKIDLVTYMLTGHVLTFWTNEKITKNSSRSMKYSKILLQNSIHPQIDRKSITCFKISK